MEEKKMAEAKLEKETCLNYNIQLFVRNIFGSISSVQQLPAKDWHVIFF
jgi:hypothetical protein